MTSCAGILLPLLALIASALASESTGRVGPDTGLDQLRVHEQERNEAPSPQRHVGIKPATDRDGRPRASAYQRRTSSEPAEISSSVDREVEAAAYRSAGPSSMDTLRAPGLAPKGPDGQAQAPTHAEVLRSLEAVNAATGAVDDLWATLTGVKPEPALGEAAQQGDAVTPEVVAGKIHLLEAQLRVVAQTLNTKLASCESAKHGMELGEPALKATTEAVQASAEALAVKVNEIVTEAKARLAQCHADGFATTDSGAGAAAAVATETGAGGLTSAPTESVPPSAAPTESVPPSAAPTPTPLEPVCIDSTTESFPQPHFNDSLKSIVPASSGTTPLIACIL